jgi:hypothetical protein
MAKKEECGRKLVVGMRLTASSREMLTWTIAKIARPGDHILALHVSTSPISGSSTTKTPLHCHFSLFMLSSSSSSSSVRGEHWHWVSSSYTSISIFFSKISNRGFCCKVLLRLRKGTKSTTLFVAERKNKNNNNQTNILLLNLTTTTTTTFFLFSSRKFFSLKSKVEFGVHGFQDCQLRNKKPN